MNIKKQLSNFAFWLLKKMKYEFKIEYDNYEIQVQPVGLPDKTPTRYDIVCDHKDIGFMNSVDMTRSFYIEEIYDTPNPRTKGVKFNDENKVINLQKQYNKLIKSVKKNGKVIVAKKA